MAFSVFGPARAPLRRAFFSVFEHALQTDDGKRLVARALNGLLAAPASSLPRLPAAVPYDDLGRSDDPLSMDAPILITARFRSGSTLLWNLFRHIPECTSYYEPLNERRWFDRAARGDRVDASHTGINDYWREYDDLAHLSRWFRESWADQRLYMDERHSDPDLVAYIEALIAAAPRRAVLQFNRVDFRLPWLRQHFPAARLIHLVRHPRSQWCSSLLNPAAVPRDVRVDQFAPYDHFYLLSWARDLSYTFECLTPEPDQHPYDLFYMLWKLSWMYGSSYSDVSVSCETLCASPEREVPRLLGVVGIDSRHSAMLLPLIAAPQSPRWEAYAPTRWFEERESHCEDLLRRSHFMTSSASDAACHRDDVARREPYAAVSTA